MDLAHIAPLPLGSINFAKSVLYKRLKFMVSCKVAIGVQFHSFHATTFDLSVSYIQHISKSMGYATVG